MRVVMHPLVSRDFNEALDYYEKESTAAALRFDEEVTTFIPAIATMPTRYSPYRGSPIFRRAKLPTFPYLVIYRIIPNGIRVTVLKHEKRHPNYGMTRW